MSKKHLMKISFKYPSFLCLFSAFAGCVFVVACNTTSSSDNSDKAIMAEAVPQQAVPKVKQLTLSEAEWKKRLSAEEYRVLREAGTEQAFTGDLWDNKATGTYVCAACKHPLFSSETKFKSGTGWPSFYQPISDTAVIEKTDSSFGMRRTEILCAKCEGHQGHVFEDGPNPTGLRYCINSVSMDFIPAKE
jgi:peptide-methionine (R)-S-oxide reductase